ncbi:MAG: Transketolase [Candidatus Adlerbacteria bacterium GW2011_GWA1_54_10]|uniref:Transketolase n=2 Tax=Candidatus Adleribacteriota TaxID=1752736 RepID=A0A0G1XXL3_9BACT|nr:MAG: Transketolase [Candidatus Adlerbacteria bacterium GW2011_GWA1_54_10]KKW37455.1 MAG: Transketolase [Candidatus Adlerbacteria bacterium GW2011_GWB1_54_7]
MDADLILDTGLIPFKQRFPDRYVEAGIAEQDMVSRAGGMALEGLLPVVHSFACFLPARANEQFYNNASEKKKIIYASSLAGLLPAGPGHSHQSVRDISIVGSIPYLTLIEPANEFETKLVLRWAVEKNPESTYMRLVSIPVEVPFSLPEGYSLERGKGVVLKEGGDAAIIAYGPIMLSESYKAAQLLEKNGVSAAVINLPWLNVIDEKWLSEVTRGRALVATLDDHYKTFGQGAMISQVLAALPNAPLTLSIGLDDIPACGTNAEVLIHHKLDAESLAQRIIQALTPEV